MSLLLHQIIRMARATFDPKNLSASSHNYRQLKELVDKLSADDINLPSSILSGRSLTSNGIPAPCGYVSLFDHPDVTISVFILAADQEMPLHDHPQMYGLLKAVSGQLRIQGFTAIDDQHQPISVTKPDTHPWINVRPEQPAIINPATNAIELSPTKGNFHQIAAVNGPAAFFDILSPPYATEIPVHGARPCTYYKIVTQEKNVCLQQASCPDTFYSITVPYRLTDMDDPINVLF